MVFSREFPQSSIVVRDWTDIIDQFFFGWPKETKPPMANDVILDKDGNVEGVRVQLALAGFNEDEIKVHVDNYDRRIYVSGDNTARENILAKFKSKFEYSIPCSGKLALTSEAVKVTFINGMLNIEIPVIEKKQKVLLFGKSE